MCVLVNVRGKKEVGKNQSEAQGTEGGGARTQAETGLAHDVCRGCPVVL